MADDWFDIDNIKITLKKAAKRPMPFAYGVGAKLGEGQIAMHPKRKPEFLGRALKKEGFKASRILVGTAQTEGSKLLVTCEAEVPKAKKSLKFFMKENGLRQKKVQLFGPNGEFDASDDDNDEQEADVAAVVAPESPDEDQITFKRRITEFAPRIKKLMAEGGAEAKPLAVKFKQAHTVGQNGDYANALTLLDDLDKQLEAVSKASPQADALNAEWNQRLKNIAPQIKEILTAKPEGFRDIALKFKEAQGFGSKNDYETGIATLDEVGAMIKSLNSNLDERKAEWAQRIKKLAPKIKEVLTAKPEGFRDIALKFKEAQGFEAKQDYETGIAMLDEVGTMIANLSGEQQKQEAEWTKRYKALESDLETVLQQNLGDPSKLRAARDMAVDKAGSGDHATALKILDRLQPAVAQALSSAKPPSEDGQAAEEPGSSDAQAEAAPPDGFAEYAKKFGAIEGAYDRVIKAIPEGPVKNELRRQMDWANAGVEKEDYKAAIAALDKLEGMLVDAPARASEEEASRKADNVFTFDYRKALLEYSRAKDSVNATLQKFVADTKAQLPEQASIAAAIQDLIFELNDELYDEVDEAMSGAAVDAADYYKSVKKVIDEYRGVIRGHDLIKHLDKKPVAFGIGNTLISALDKLDKSIAA